MKKNFLHICLSSSWGGLEMAVIKWNKILQENGHSNFNICSPQSPLSQALTDSGAQQEQWPNKKYFSPQFTWKLRQFLKAKNIDVVVLQNLRDLWIISPALIGLPNIQLVGFAQMLLGIKKTDWLHHKVYQRLDHLLTLTDWQSEALLPYLPVPQEKYATIPNFVDTQQFSPTNRDETYRQSIHYTPNDIVIGCIGRIDQQKGQMELLKAFDKCHQQLPNARLLFVGEPTRGEEQQIRYFHSLKDYVSKHKLNQKVQFMDFQKDTTQLFASIDLFVLPSYKETFGYVVVEAMASGTTVLATKAGGVPEILQQGRCGFLFEPKNSEDLAEQLINTFADSQRKQDKTAKALEHAQSFYDRSEVYKRFIEVIDSKVRS